MSNKLDDISNKLTDALDKTEKVDDYAANIKMLITVGIVVIILAIITLIGSTFVIIKRKK
jgi:CHASE3 domain sensor protein